MIETEKLYGVNDMVKAGCSDCEGCHACCKGMGDTILLDPYDICCLTIHLNKSMDMLLQKEVELSVKDGLILPNLAMQKDSNACAFLDADGRCSIHSFRPGLCRLFPLGRQYANGEVFYFLVPEECTKQNKSKVKVKKWLGIADSKAYQKFLLQWYSLKKQTAALIEKEEDAKRQKDIVLFLLQQFYRKPYTEENFYEEFEVRLAQAQEVLGLEQ